jgi:hypothetical protein
MFFTSCILGICIRYCSSSHCQTRSKLSHSYIINNFIPTFTFLPIIQLVSKLLHKQPLENDPVLSQLCYLILLKFMLHTANLILPNHESAWQYTHETQFASAAEVTWLQVCSKRTCTSTEDNDWTVDTHKMNTITENVLKMILQNEHELILEKSNITLN